ncbi:MAG: thioredoxin family protein [Bacteroidota bacterium]|nr:thioredoxin family protein [Bacteroidota bacterium]
MKQLVIALFTIIPFLSFSQGAVKNEIDWISLEKAKVLSKQHNEKILIFFYKKNCEYCEKMKKETLSDPSVIQMINNNFFPVKIDSRTKDTIMYNGKAYGNQQPASSGRHDWRHDFYAEVAAFERNGNSQITTPCIVLFNNNFEKIITMPGNHPKELLLRRLKNYIK